jgi:hypothetical protein
VRHAEGLHVAEPGPVQPAPSAQPAPVRATSGLVTARELVERAQASARIEPALWGAFAIRVPASLKKRMDHRWLADRTRLHDYDLAQGHFAEAALCEIPGDIEAAAAWGAAYTIAHPRREQPATISPRVRLVTADRMRDLSGQLRVRPQVVRAWEVQAAALERLLNRLDAEDE